jgi:hypothetical protein
MLIDLTLKDVELIIKKLNEDDEEEHQVLLKLVHYVHPEVDESKLVEKYQEWKQQFDKPPKAETTKTEPD